VYKAVIKVDVRRMSFSQMIGSKRGNGSRQVQWLDASGKVAAATAPVKPQGRAVCGTRSMSNLCTRKQNGAHGRLVVVKVCRPEM
jgi:hypothetical protein